MKSLRLYSAVLAVLLVFAVTVPVCADDSDIDAQQTDELEKIISDLERNISSIRQNLDEHKKDVEPILKDIARENESS